MVTHKEKILRLTLRSDGEKWRSLKTKDSSLNSLIQNVEKNKFRTFLLQVNSTSI